MLQVTGLNRDSESRDQGIPGPQENTIYRELHIKLIYCPFLAVCEFLSQTMRLPLLKAVVYQGEDQYSKILERWCNSKMSINWQFDASQYSPVRFEQVKPGKYKAQIVAVEHMYSQRSGLPQVSVTFKPEGVNGRVRYKVTLFPRGHEHYEFCNGLMGDLASCVGVPVENFLSDEHIAVGAIGFIEVEESEYQGKKFSRVARCIPREELPQNLQVSTQNPAPLQQQNLNPNPLFGDGDSNTGFNVPF